MRNQNERVTCLGKTFDSDEARRDYFREELRKKLPELKKIDGFPIGEDEDIIALSDPPYYTACPNPWLNDFIDEWENEKASNNKRKQNFQIEEPYSSNITDKKNHPLYNAHSYHTKVPHTSIMRFLLYYTQPGDIIFDGFSGTGMTGVAAAACDEPDNLTKNTIESEFSKNSLQKVVWGARKAILGDISPLSSFIGYNYSFPLEHDIFIKFSEKIYDELYNEYNWMYKTKHSNGKLCDIKYVIWSEMQICVNCNNEFSYWETAINYSSNIVKDTYNCPNCNFEIDKRTSKKSFKTEFDEVLKKTIKTVKVEPVIINYVYNKQRYEKKLDEYDFEVLNKIENYKIASWVPHNEISPGDKTGDPFRLGINTPHQFYTKRNLIILSNFYNSIQKIKVDERLRNYLLIWFTSCHSRLHKMNRYSVKHGRHVGPMANTLYISSNPTEISPFYFIKSKIKDNSLDLPRLPNVINQIRSSVNTGINSNSVDYMFIDPPFGSNIMYSELNVVVESWLKLLTNNISEAIENNSQGKTLLDYRDLMTKSFSEFYRILKPNKWMTVEFSNTSASVWNSIQYSIQKSGFIIASVFMLNKGRGGLQAIIGPTAVKQDLIISCYKPSINLESLFKEQKANVNLWEFIKEHLLHLPIHIKKDNNTATLLERSPKVLYDRLISFYLMRGLNIPIDAKDFHNNLKLKFQERDGMYFTDEQAIEYDIRKASAPNLIQLSLLVTSENEGIEWLRMELSSPQKYQDLQPKWMQAITAIRKGDILPELRDILNENFIQESNGKWRVPDLSEAKDRDIIRNKSLLKEFNTYLEEISKPKGKKLKEVRVEALRIGFKACWEKKDFATIVNLGERIPQNILLEDDQLLMYYDIAKDRI